MAYVNTVLGPIHPDQMGFTAMHEHVMWGPPGWQYDPDWWWSLPRVFEKCTQDFIDFRQLGGGTFVDVSGIGLGRDLDFYVNLARASRVNLVACTGFWADQGILPYFRVKDIDYHEQLYIRELTKGMGHTNIKAGIIKVGNTSRQPMSDLEILTYRAAARAAKKTGACVTTHGITAARQQFEILTSEGLDPDRIVIGHVDAAYCIDIERDKELARKGAYVGYDHIGIEPWSPMPYNMFDEKRVELVQEMLADGHRDRIILSCDVNCHSLGWYKMPHKIGKNDTPLHTVGHLLRYFVPNMRKHGIDEDTIRHLLVENPKRVLPIQASQS
jgi:phosphotriesterase-related protein